MILMNDLILLIYGSAFTIVGIIIGTVIKYLNSKLTLKEQLEKAPAYDFIVNHYYPLLNSLFLVQVSEEYFKRKFFKGEIAKKMHNSYLLNLEKTMDNIIESGVLYLISNVDINIGKVIFSLNTMLKNREIKPYDSTKIEMEVREFQETSPLRKKVEDLALSLVAIKPSKLVKKYRKALKQGI